MDNDNIEDDDGRMDASGIERIICGDSTEPHTVIVGRGSADFAMAANAFIGVLAACGPHLLMVVHHIARSPAGVVLTCNSEMAEPLGTEDPDDEFAVQLRRVWGEMAECYDFPDELVFVNGDWTPDPARINDAWFCHRFKRINTTDLLSDDELLQVVPAERIYVHDVLDEVTAGVMEAVTRELLPEAVETAPPGATLH